MNDNLDDYLPPDGRAFEKPKRGRPPGKKVAASRITGGAGAKSRSVGVHVRFPEADFRRIAAIARSNRASDAETVRTLARRGLDFEGVTDGLKELVARLGKLEAELDETRWRSMSGRLRWFEETLDEIRSGSGPLVEAIAQGVLKAMLEHDAKIDARKNSSQR